MSKVNNEAQTSELTALTRRNLIAAALAGVWGPGIRGQSPAIVTSKNHVQSPSCTLAPEATEGPYYIDGALIRSDITEGRPGIPLRLRIMVLDGLGCKPITNAAVSIWHCDASGVYSGFTANSPDGPPGVSGRRGLPPGMGRMPRRPPGPPPSDGFARGEGPPPPPFGGRRFNR